MDQVGVLMIGGASRRMGSPKQLLPREGQPLGLVLATLLGRHCTRVVISGAGPWPEAQPYTRVADREPGAGPLSGLLGVVDALGRQPLMVLATDMAAMDGAALAWLAARSDELGTASACRPRFPERELGEPLAALYLPDAVDHWERAWSLGQRSPIRAVPLEACYQPIIPEHFREQFGNANTPEQWRRLSRE